VVELPKIMLVSSVRSGALEVQFLVTLARDLAACRDVLVWSPLHLVYFNVTLTYLHIVERKVWIGKDLNVGALI
jgi:hypothetical protein